MTVMDCRDPATWGAAIDEAVHVLARGGLVVLPTDTVYGVAADAFTPPAVQALAAAKGRDATVAPPVLLPGLPTMHGVCADVGEAARVLAERFWPGPLTLVCRAQPSLAWELGGDPGSVAVRVPDHPVALAVLRRTGPLAVSGAHRTSDDVAPTGVQQALATLGAAVALYLDAGKVAGGPRSTVVDVRSAVPVVLREGAIGLAALREVTDVDPGPDVDPRADVDPGADVDPNRAAADGAAAPVEGSGR